MTSLYSLLKNLRIKAIKMLIFLAYFRFSLYLYTYERASYGYIKSITRHDGRNAIVAWNCQPAVCRDYQIEPVRCQTKVHNCKYSYLLCNIILLFSEILLLIEFCFIVSLILLISSPCPKYTSLGVRLSNDSWNLLSL